MVYGDAREGKWRGNWRMEWVASTLHTTSEHGVFSITTADAHTSAACSRLNWRRCRFKWTRPFRRKTKSGSCAYAITFQLASTLHNFFLSFFLILASFYVLTVGREGHCCPWWHSMTHTHTHARARAVWLLWTGENNTHKRETTMPPTRFEHAILASEQPQTYALDRAATGIEPVTTMLIKSGRVSWKHEM